MTETSDIQKTTDIVLHTGRLGMSSRWQGGRWDRQRFCQCCSSGTACYQFPARCCCTSTFLSCVTIKYTHTHVHTPCCIHHLTQCWFKNHWHYII